MYIPAGLNGFLYILLTILLIVISVMDYRTYKIPPWTIVAIGIVGTVYLIFNPDRRNDGLIGFFFVSIPLCFIYLLTGGRGIGGGDIKLMAVSGLLLGWQKNILAFLTACVLVACVYLIRKARRIVCGRRLAFGPYLAAGIMISLVWGGRLIFAYMSWPGLVF